MRFISVILFVFIANCVFAQQSTINGVVADKNSTPIGYATVVLYTLADSVYVAGTVTDSTGVFSIKAKRGDYFVEATHINYQRSNIPLTISDRDSVVETIYLSAAVINLDEVIVVGKTPAVRLTSEKSIYNVSDMSASKSGSMKDLLKTVPSLTVDFNDNVMLNGAPARFIVDGQEVSSGELAAYTPSQIASIEIIANPTSKYDASGLSGIVQLVSKKNRTSGVSGTVNLSGAHDTQIVSGGVNYNQNKFNVSSNFSLWKNYQHGSIESITGDRSTLFNQIKADVIDIVGNVKFNYNLNQNNTLSISYQYLNLGYLADDSSLNRAGRTEMNGATHQFAAGYNRNISANGGALKANFYYNTTSPTTHSTFDYTNQQITILNNNSNSSFVATVDYFVPFTENANFEAGIKSHTRNILIARTDDFSGEPEHDKFRKSENILAGYVLMNSRMERFNVQVGVRMESNLATEANNRKKIDLFSNISLSYAMNESNMFSLGYNKRINRPSAADMNPFLLLVDPTSRFKGNPNLLPEYAHNLFVDYTGNFQSHKLKIAAYYKRISDLITKTNEVVDNDILYTPVNIPLAHFGGIDITTTHNFGKRWTLQPSAGVLFTTIPSEVSEPLRQNSSYYAGLTVSVKLPCNFNIQALAKYTSRTLSVGSAYQSAMVQGLAIGKSQFWSELSVSKSLWRDNINLSLRITDPFSLLQKGYTNYSVASKQDISYHFDTRFVFFCISYKFNNHKVSKQNYDDGGIKVF